MILSMKLVTGRTKELNAGWSKGKVASHEGIWRSGGKSPHILNLGAKWSWVITFMLQLLYSRGRATSKHWIGDWVDPRTGRDGLEDIKIPTRFVPLCTGHLDSVDCSSSAPTRYMIKTYWLQRYRPLELSVPWTGYFPRPYLFVSMTTCQLHLAPVPHVEFTRCSLHTKDMQY